MADPDVHDIERGAPADALADPSPEHADGEGALALSMTVDESMDGALATARVQADAATSLEAADADEVRGSVEGLLASVVAAAEADEVRASVEGLLAGVEAAAEAAEGKPPDEDEGGADEARASVEGLLAGVEAAATADEVRASVDGLVAGVEAAAEAAEGGNPPDEDEGGADEVRASVEGLLASVVAAAEAEGRGEAGGESGAEEDEEDEHEKELVEVADAHRLLSACQTTLRRLRHNAMDEAARRNREGGGGDGERAEPRADDVTRRRALRLWATASAARKLRVTGLQMTAHWRRQRALSEGVFLWRRWAGHRRELGHKGELSVVFVRTALQLRCFNAWRYWVSSYAAPARRATATAASANETRAANVRRRCFAAWRRTARANLGKWRLAYAQEEATASATLAAAALSHDETLAGLDDGVSTEALMARVVAPVVERAQAMAMAYVVYNRKVRLWRRANVCMRPAIEVDSPYSPYSRHTTAPTKLGGNVLSALYVYAAGRRHGDTLKRIGQRAHYQRRLRSGLRRLAAWREAGTRAKAAKATIQVYVRQRRQLHAVDKWRALCEWRSWTREVGRGAHRVRRIRPHSCPTRQSTQTPGPGRA